MKIITKLIPFLIILLAFSSCRKDNEELIDQGTNSPNPVVKIETTFNGTVKDENGEALEGARITIDGKQTQSDMNGYFILETDANVEGAFIKVNLSGYYEAYGNIIPSEGLTYVQFVMIAKEDGTTFNSSTARTVQNGANKVSFEANSFKHKNGDPYTGEVTVYMDYIDPTAENFGLQMPGDLPAYNQSFDPIILESFGMVNVEIYSAAGEELDITKNAQLEIAVPKDLINNAPNQIPMWYFDVDLGYWVEEGIATLAGDIYQTEVSHFTLWNCDVPIDFITLEGLVFYSDVILKNVKVEVTWVNENQSRTTSTDDKGIFQGKVPNDASLKVEVFDDCNNPIYSEIVGPFSSDAQINCVCSFNNYETIEVFGTVLDCDDNPVSNGYALVQLENGSAHQAHTDVNGAFSIDLVNCNESESVDVTGIDMDALLQSATAGVNIFNNEADAGYIRACDFAIENIFEIVTPDTTLVFTGVGVNVTQMENGLPVVMEYIFLDKDGLGNKAIYTLTFLDWTLGAGNQEQTWIVNSSFQELGSMEVTWDFNFADSFTANLIDSNTYLELNWDESTGPGTIESSTGEVLDVDEVLIRGLK